MIHSAIWNFRLNVKLNMKGLNMTAFIIILCICMLIDPLLDMIGDWVIEVPFKYWAMFSLVAYVALS